MKVIAAIIFTSCLTFAVRAQQPVIVQPGAPGQPTKTLPADTKGKLPKSSPKDVEFMRGMIHHHAQAVEMTALIEERTVNKEIRKLGAKISQSQSDEINFMRRWLTLRGESTEMKMNEKSDSNHSSAGGHLMPGMLTPKQLSALKNAKGADFDRLFLKGMIQHHQGALEMVKDLFATPGAGQDAELFNFASDVDTSQKGEIKIMKDLLERKIKQEKK